MLFLDNDEAWPKFFGKFSVMRKEGGCEGGIRWYWSQTVAIDVLLCFYFAVVFSLLYFCFRQVKQNE